MVRVYKKKDDTPKKSKWYVAIRQSGEDVWIDAVDKQGNVIKTIAGIMNNGIYLSKDAEILDYADPYPVDENGRIKVVNGDKY